MTTFNKIIIQIVRFFFYCMKSLELICFCFSCHFNVQETQYLTMKYNL